MEVFTNRLIVAISNLIIENMVFSQGYTYYIGRQYPNHPSIPRTTRYNYLFINDIEKIYPIERIVSVLQKQFKQYTIYYDDINEAIRVRAS